MSVTERHDMTLDVKMELKPNTTNQDLHKIIIFTCDKTHETWMNQ